MNVPTKTQLISVAKEMNKVLELDPPFDLTMRKAELISEIKEGCRDCIKPGDDFSLATLNVLEALGFEFPDEPMFPPENTVQDAAEVILEFMPIMLEKLTEIIETLNDWENSDPDLSISSNRRQRRQRRK